MAVYMPKLAFKMAKMAFKFYEMDPWRTILLCEGRSKIRMSYFLLGLTSYLAKGQAFTISVFLQWGLFN